MTKLYKMIFFSMLTLSTLLSISSYTWIGTWMGLEINLLSFIPLMKMNNNALSSESSMKYFLIQAIASSMFMLTIILSMMMNNFINESNFINEMLILIMNSMMMLKMGTAPFHFWFPQIIEGMNWNYSLILMTWQKITPMVLLSYMIKSSNFIIIAIVMSTLIGSIGGLNQTSLRKIMAFSSINHMGWMMSTFLYNETLWTLYFLIYCSISISIIMILKNYNIYYIKQLYNSFINNLTMKLLMMLNFMSLGGLPPFLGFFPKWIVIQFLMNNYSYLILFMILMTLITLYFYLRISITSILLINNEINNFKFMNNNNVITMYMFSFISIFGLIFISFLFNFI